MESSLFNTLRFFLHRRQVWRTKSWKLGGNFSSNTYRDWHVFGMSHKIKNKNKPKNSNNVTAALVFFGAVRKGTSLWQPLAAQNWISPLTSLGLSLFTQAKGLIKSVADLKALGFCIIGTKFFTKAQIDKCCKTYFKYKDTPYLQWVKGWMDNCRRKN